MYMPGRSVRVVRSERQPAAGGKTQSTPLHTTPITAPPPPLTELRRPRRRVARVPAAVVRVDPEEVAQAVRHEVRGDVGREHLLDLLERRRKQLGVLLAAAALGLARPPASPP